MQGSSAAGQDAHSGSGSGSIREAGISSHDGNTHASSVPGPSRVRKPRAWFAPRGRGNGQHRRRPHTIGVSHGGLPGDSASVEIQGVTSEGGQRWVSPVADADEDDEIGDQGEDGFGKRWFSDSIAQGTMVGGATTANVGSSDWATRQVIGGVPVIEPDQIGARRHALSRWALKGRKGRTWGQSAGTGDNVLTWGESVGAVAADHHGDADVADVAPSPISSSQPMQLGQAKHTGQLAAGQPQARSAARHTRTDGAGS